MNEQYTDSVIAAVEKMTADEINEQFLALTAGRQFGSRHDPGREAAVWADSFYEQGKDIFIVLGSGATHYHDELCRRLGKDQQLFVIDWQLPMIAAARDGLKALRKRPNVTVLLCDNVNQTSYTVTTVIDKFLTRKLKLGFIPPYHHFFPEEVKTTHDELRKYLSVNVVRARTIELFGLEWATNLHENLPYIFKGVPFKNFTGRFSGVPAIVVSAGPSLEQNVELLRDLHDKALIIASGSAIETLMKVYGIVPHLLASLDPGKGNYPHFQNLDTGKLRLMFLCDIYPPILREFKGTLIPSETLNKTNYDLYKDSGAPELGGAMAGPSVSNFAMDIAVQLGCEPVVIIGQDLALKDGKSHAAGNFYRTETADFSKYLKVKGNIEEFVYTDRSWLTMLKHFEHQLRSYAGHTIINATEGGAFIEGTVVKTLREVIAEYMTETRDIEAFLQEIIDGAQPVEADAAVIQEKVAAAAGEIEKMAGECLDEVAKILSQLKGGALSAKLQRRIKALKRTEDKILESLVYQYIVKPIIHGRLLYFERQYTQLAGEHPEKVETWVAEYQKILFTAVRDALRAFLGSIESENGQSTEGSALDVH
jgi:hypothetical protein